MIIKSFAKINLGLNIVNQRFDGYHNIKSIFIQISLNDKLHFIPSEKFTIESKGIKVPNNQSNTIFKAAKLLETEFNINIKHKIIIDKNIPVGGGLGGGSSNAAYTLKTLNQLYNLNLEKSDLLILAQKLGSDVPFFIDGGIKLIKGTGNIIKNIQHGFLNDKHILLIFPNFSISTTWAFGEIKKDLDTNKKQSKFPPLTNNVKLILFVNDFENIVCKAYPEILKIKELLNLSGAIYSGLSGSGSTLFGIYKDKKTLKKSLKFFNSYHTHITHPLIQ